LSHYKVNVKRLDHAPAEEFHQYAIFYWVDQSKNKKRHFNAACQYFDAMLGSLMLLRVKKSYLTHLRIVFYRHTVFFCLTLFAYGLLINVFATT